MMPLCHICGQYSGGKGRKRKSPAAKSTASTATKKDTSVEDSSSALTAAPPTSSKSSSPSTSSSSNEPVLKRSKSVKSEKSWSSQETKTAKVDDDLNNLYHAGDLEYSKRDTLASFMDGYKTTGHFGTGVYFVAGAEGLEIIQKNNVYNKRPIFRLRLEQFTKACARKGYQMYRPKTEKKAKELHAFFKEIHDSYYDLIKKLSQEEETTEEFSLDGPALANIRTWTYELKDILGIPNNKVEEVEEKIKSAFLQGINVYVRNRHEFGRLRSKFVRSISTMIMIKLRYAGIDVSHLPALNNLVFGTVIYKEKIEEGCAIKVQK